MTDDIIIRRDGAAGRITLNRPDALNALTLPMIHAMQGTLDDWRHDRDVLHVIIDAMGGKAFAAGGDLKSLYDSRPGGSAEDTAFHGKFFRDEYVLNATIAHYPKPYVALMDGIVMGGGIGVSALGSHRIVTERAQLAMPEVGVGLIPDVGGTFLLSRSDLPPGLGRYLALTGSRMPAADAMRAGFADTFVMSDQLPRLTGELCLRDADLDGLIAGQARPAPQTAFENLSLERIAEIFTNPDVAAIHEALAADDSDWAAATLKTLGQKSPLSLAVTSEALSRAAAMSDVTDALTMEYHLVRRCFEIGDFLEGIRAAVIDKDRTPRWRHATVNDISTDDVAAFFAPLPANELPDFSPR